MGLINHANSNHDNVVCCIKIIPKSVSTWFCQRSKWQMGLLQEISKDTKVSDWQWKLCVRLILLRPTSSDAKWLCLFGRFLKDIAFGLIQRVVSSFQISSVNSLGCIDHPLEVASVCRIIELFCADGVKPTLRLQDSNPHSRVLNWIRVDMLLVTIECLSSPGNVPAISCHQRCSSYG